MIWIWMGFALLFILAMAVAVAVDIRTELRNVNKMLKIMEDGRAESERMIYMINKRQLEDKGP